MWWRPIHSKSCLQCNIAWAKRTRYTQCNRRSYTVQHRWNFYDSVLWYWLSRLTRDAHKGKPDWVSERSNKFWVLSYTLIRSLCGISARMDPGKCGNPLRYESYVFDRRAKIWVPKAHLWLRLEVSRSWRNRLSGKSDWWSIKLDHIRWKQIRIPVLTSDQARSCSLERQRHSNSIRRCHQGSFILFSDLLSLEKAWWTAEI